MSNGSTGNRLEDTLQDDDTGAAKHVLLVDPDGDVRKVVSDLLLDLGFRVSTAEDAATMRALLDRESIELIVLDASPSAPREADLALEAKENGIRLVMISGHPDVMKRFQDRADQLLWKPFGREGLKRALCHALASDVRGQRKEDPG
jgi:DNA-binding NtrC family response regulator